MSGPESFSPNNAKGAVEDIFKALPKIKQIQYIGAFNEVLVVIGRLTQKSKVDPDKEVK